MHYLLLIMLNVKEPTEPRSTRQFLQPGSVQRSTPSIPTRLFGRLKESLFLEVEPDVSCVRCHCRPAASYGSTDCAGINPGKGGFLGRRTGGLPPTFCSVVLPT